jgi:hypothetical protein
VRAVIGWPEVNILGVEDVASGSLFVEIETRAGHPGCSSCGVPAGVQDRDPVLLVDMPAFGALAHASRSALGAGTVTGVEPRTPCSTDRAGRWVTEQVGRVARRVSEVVAELGCDWHS